MLQKSYVVLDDQVIVEVCKFLELDQLFLMFTLNKQYNRALQSQHLWRHLILKYFYIDVPKYQKVQILLIRDQQLNCKLQFRTLYEDTNWRPYLEIILQRLGLNPAIWKNSNVRHSTKALKDYYGEVPLSYLRLYQLFNEIHLGQLYGLDYNTQFHLMFGGYKFYDQLFGFILTPFIKPTGYCPHLAQKKIHPFGEILPTHKQIFADWGNTLGFGHETIFAYLTQAHQHGQANKIFILNNSLKSFFQERVNSEEVVVKTSYPDVRVYDIVDTKMQPGSDTTTNGIRIRATAKFVPWIRNQNDNLFMYQIRISDGGVNNRFRLLSRRWAIKFGTQVENVEGEGVIGLYPEIYPDCPDFIYESCCNITTFNGVMEGGFTFKNIETQETFEAKIMPFPLKLATYEKYLNLLPDGKIEIIADGDQQQII